MVQFGSSMPLWVSVPTVSVPVFIGTRSNDPYGHVFYRYFTGTDSNALVPVAPVDPTAIEIAERTSTMLLQFVDPASLLPFVGLAKMRLVSFGLARREHIILNSDSDERNWLYTPIAEVNKFVIDNEVITDINVDNGLFRIGSTDVLLPAPNGKALLVIPFRVCEIHYAIGNQFPFVEDALPYFVAAAYLRAVSDNQSGIYESIRVGAVSFSFRSVRELRERAQQLERTGLGLIRAGGLG